MSVSVIIPTYNSCLTLARAVNSVLGQTLLPNKIIVVDDGSTDDTRTILQKMPVQYIYQKNQGVSAARNKGWSNATGDYIAFLDADDCWLPNKLMCQVAFMEKHPEIGFCYGKYKSMEAATIREEGFSLLLSGILCRRALVETVGGFNEDLRNHEDTDWFMRISDKGIKSGKIEQFLFVKHKQSGSLSNFKDAVLNKEEFLRMMAANIKARQKRN